MTELSACGRVSRPTSVRHSGPASREGAEDRPPQSLGERALALDARAPQCARRWLACGFGQGSPTSLILRHQEALLAHPHARDTALAVVMFATCRRHEGWMERVGKCFPDEILSVTWRTPRNCKGQVRRAGAGWTHTLRGAGGTRQEAPVQLLRGAHGCVGPDVAASVLWMRDKQTAVRQVDCESRFWGNDTQCTPASTHTCASIHTEVGALPADGSPRGAGVAGASSGTSLILCLSRLL